MIWYKFHLGDYITHTTHLSDAEDLAYRRLLDLYYMSEKPIPLDTQSVSRKIRLDLDITESVLGEFFEHTPEGYRNARCDAEIAKYQHQVENNRSLGKRGGRPKKTESETESKPKANPKKIQNKNINTNTSTASTPSRFDEFWSTWPTSKRKVGRAAVLAKWEKHNLDDVADTIIANVKALKASEQWLGGYEPAPMTYINQRRWEDDPVQSPAMVRRVI
jgi:uncharacterized protein YdaU (DUF1376 family)